MYHYQQPQIPLETAGCSGKLYLLGKNNVHSDGDLPTSYYKGDRLYCMLDSFSLPLQYGDVYAT
jgi:hypothetical protein